MEVVLDSIWFDVWITFMGLMGFLFVYTIPSFIAYLRVHRNLTEIMVVNVLLGFLIIPWIATLLYASFSRSAE